MSAAIFFLAIACTTFLGDKTDSSERAVVFLAEDRPVFLRVRTTEGDRPFEQAWPDSIQALVTCLDRDGDGKLSKKEADKDVLAALVRLANGPAAVQAAGNLDLPAKDGIVSKEAIIESLRGPLGPFRVQLGQRVSGRTDALFEHLDQDKDGQLTRRELGVIAGSLRRLDLDDNEVISADELEPFNNPAAFARAENANERRERYLALPPVVEIVAGESSLRLARLLLKKYDKGRDDTPGRPDGKLSLNEFAIDPDVFSAADSNSDDSLNIEELRKYLAGSPVDIALNVAFSSGTDKKSTAKVTVDGTLPKGVKLREHGDGEMEFAVGRVRLDIHVDAGDATAANVRRVLTKRFEAADSNKNGYLEGKELAAENAAGAPLAGLTGVVDRDGDGKLYPKELSEFVDRQLEAAKGRIVLTASDLGRAIFGILDLDRDRRLGAREVMRTVDRVMSWDSDGDDRVSAEEIPYHFRVSISRSELSGIGVEANNTIAVRSMTATISSGSISGPEWFRKMDRNRDGDVSRREFLGPREAFDRLDRDKDGLIDADEAGK